MKINWQIRLSNPTYIKAVLMAILVPILAYMGMSAEDITSWEKLYSLLATVITNPYLLAVVITNVSLVTFDPTSKGLSDCDKTLQLKKED